jgi:hypothetical protein
MTMTDAKTISKNYSKQLYHYILLQVCICLSNEHTYLLTHFHVNLNQFCKIASTTIQFPVREFADFAKRF